MLSQAQMKKAAKQEETKNVVGWSTEMMEETSETRKKWCYGGASTRKG